MVDLPGLFHANTTEQSGADIVDTMVRVYMENTRCIILAVISAKNELALQKVTTLTREIDPIGRRTLGIITKPDWLRPGSDMEHAFVALANNEDIKIRLGWHILENRDHDHRDCTGEERDRLEEEWLSQGVWAALPRHQLGVNALRDRLCVVLQNLILSEIPSLTQDLEKAVNVSNANMIELGDARENVSQQRHYLIRSSEKFTTLLSYAIHGTYDADAFFGDPMTEDGFHKRLRAVVKWTLKDFSRKMAEQGQARRIIDDTDLTGEGRVDCITRSRYVEEVRVLMERTQGRELRGTFNPMIIGDLFYAQAKPWFGIVNKYTAKLVGHTRWNLSALSAEVFDSKTGEGLQKQVINPAMDAIEEKLRAKIEEIILPHQQGHPITQNHYFIKNIQKARLKHWKRAFLDKLLNDMDGYDQRFTKAEVLNAMNALEEDDMERFACLEAIDCMEAYYKVARKIVVDEFATLAIELSLLKSLPSILSPKVIDDLDDLMIQEIAAETTESQGERARLIEKLSNLDAALKALHRLDRHKPVGLDGSVAKNSHMLLTLPPEDTQIRPKTAADAGTRDEPVADFATNGAVEEKVADEALPDDPYDLGLTAPSKKDKKPKKPRNQID